MMLLPTEQSLGKGHEDGTQWRARHGEITGAVAGGCHSSGVVENDEGGHQLRTVSVRGAPERPVCGSHRLTSEWDHEGDARGSAKRAGGMTAASRIFDQPRVSRPKPL